MNTWWAPFVQAALFGQMARVLPWLSCLQRSSVPPAALCAPVAVQHAGAARGPDTVAAAFRDAGGSPSARAGGVPEWQSARPGFIIVMRPADLAWTPGLCRASRRGRPGQPPWSVCVCSWTAAPHSAPRLPPPGGGGEEAWPRCVRPPAGHRPRPVAAHRRHRAGSPGVGWKQSGHHLRSP